MALSRQELVDTLAGLTLFADLRGRSSSRWPTRWPRSRSRSASASCARASPARASTSSSTARSRSSIDGTDVAHLGKGDFFGEMSILLGEPPVADIVTMRQLDVLHLGGRELERFLRDHPPGDVPDAQDGRAAAAQRQPDGG